MTDEKNEVKTDEENCIECENCSEKKPCDELEKKPKSEKLSRKAEAEILKHTALTGQAVKERDEALDKYQRVLAEYDNFRKRSQKEKEGIYTDAYAEALKEILPIIDNLERATNFSEGENLLKGLKMILSQCESALNKLGIEAIDPKPGDKFNPDLHDAVMHDENAEYSDNTIVNVLQKGYKKGDKVFRYAMVSVAN